jgi:phospholipid-transporting ATPase
MKRRFAPKVTASLPEQQLASLKATVSCELPNVRLYHFEGNLRVPNENSVPLTANNLLQRGGELRNTEGVYGIVVYAGTDTKLFKNLDTTVNKVGHLEVMLNRTVVALFLLQLLLIAVSGILASAFQASTARKSPYLSTDESSARVGLLSLLSYFVLYTYLIPISLFVTMEIVRLIQAVFMLWDEEMPGNTPRNSNANENLGLIQHVFSDKTGTLTRNVMRLTRLFIDGAAFDEEAEVGATRRLSRSKPVVMKKVDAFLRNIALCNTAVPDAEEVPGTIVYQADSPDEEALLKCAQANGFELCSRRSDTVTVREEAGERDYKVLAVLEFTADRKRMSVVYERADGVIMLVCKGADTYIMERARDNDPLLDQIKTAVNQYASEGLRTLVFAEKELERASFTAWLREFATANSSLDGREKKVHDQCEKLEVGLELLGCTGVEDRLQDDVPATIKYLFDAGIQVWLLTGDKQETAINIGHSSQLILPDFEVCIVNALDSHHCGTLLLQHEAYYEQHPGVQFAVVIDGKTLEFALDHFPLHFISLGAKAKSVIVSRATPLQKARVVRLAREQLKVMALAIGDGSNDVAMIQEAEVGVGILGREGSQAARASDYAISEFKHLRRLVCVHGRYCYLRSAGLIQYSFYKNLAFILPQFYFGFWSGFCAQVYYDEWLLSLFNIIFTSLPPLLYGFTEKDVSEATIEKNPAVYQRNQGFPLYNARTFALWVLNAVYHSFIFFFFVISSGLGTDPVERTGHTGDQWSQAILASMIAVTTVILKFALFAKTWTIVTHFAVWTSLLLFYAFLVGYSFWWWLQPDM